MQLRYKKIDLFLLHRKKYMLCVLKPDQKGRVTWKRVRQTCPFVGIRRRKGFGTRRL